MEDHVKESLAEAKNCLNQAEEAGVMAYNLCDGILTNIKGFVHEDVTWMKINEHEQKVHEEFQKRLSDARKKLDGIDPLFAWDKGMKQYLSLRQWKSLEMLNFYDKLVKTNEFL